MDQDQDCARTVWAVLPSLIRTIAAHLRQQEPRLELTMWQIMVMKWLQSEALTVSDLARKFMVSTPTMTRLLDNLVERQLVERHEDPADRRRVRVFLTEKGLEAFQEFNKRALSCVEDIMADLEVEERRQVAAAMEILQEALLRSSTRKRTRRANG